jgi:Holliday junction resolvasome RuvABC endonuclease subunit
VPLLPLTATTVKQRITGAGHATKEQVQRMVLRLTGYAPGQVLRADVTDAIALALAGLHQLRYQQVHPALSGARRR